MKYLLIIYLLASCNTISSDPEGMYTCKYENEFSKVSDTLWLKKINNNYYHVNRHSGVLIKETEKEKLMTELWKLTYENNVFTDIRTGRTFSWDDNKLIFGNRTYIRKL